MRAALRCFVAALVVGTTSCDDAAVARCADGAALHVIDDHAYCVYPAGGGPARDTCPPDVPTLVVRRGVTVCTDDPSPTAESFGDLCMEPGVTCASGGTEGWSQLPGTKIETVCPARPDIHGVVGCEAVVSGWSGGVADTLHDRLIAWGGGGGSNYFGNEVYALDVSAGTIARLTEPSDPVEDCAGRLPDGRPQSRATYDNLAFVSHAGRMLAWGGQVAGESCAAADDTWTFDATTLEWEEQAARSDQPLSREGIAASDYDPETRLVFLHETHNLFSYDIESATFTHLAESDLAPESYAFVGRVDVAGRRFVVIGGGVAYAFDLTPGASYASRALSLDGCSDLVDTNYPGLAYDPVAQKLVGWAGGGTAYVIDAVADTCEARAIDGGPRSPQANGTNGRFRYFASLDGFVLINATDDDAWVLRLRGE